MNTTPTRYGNDGPCTLDEAQEDDEERTRVVDRVTGREATAYTPPEDRVTVDVPAAARAGEAAWDVLAVVKDRMDQFAYDEVHCVLETLEDAIAETVAERDEARAEVERLRHRAELAEAERDAAEVLLPRAEAAEAKVARAGMVADEHEAWMNSTQMAGRKGHTDLREREEHRAFVAEVRAALADPAPVEQQDDEAGR